MKILILFLCCVVPLFAEEKNPVLKRGESYPDGKMGAFKQKEAGNCFFLAALISLANDEDGRRLLDQCITKEGKSWIVKFPNIPEKKWKINIMQLVKHRLTNAYEEDVVDAKLTSGDADIKLLEIAADLYWKKAIKKEGLWDDVEMNVYPMFSASQMQLLWNEENSPELALQDVAKADKLPKGVLLKRGFTNVKSLEAELKKIVDKDADGISITFGDYELYHALAILEFDFKNRTYIYVDPHDSKMKIDGDLDDFLKKVIEGWINICVIEP